MAINSLAVKEAWKRILGWFEQNAPASEKVYRDAIPGPATPEEISECEKKLGLTFPSSLIESYLLFNGHQYYPVFDCGAFMSTAEVTDKTLMWRRNAKEYGSDPSTINCSDAIRRTLWNKGWIPFIDNGSSDHCCIDLNPTKAGVVGQVFRFSHEQGPKEVLANSFEEFLTVHAYDLEAGKYRWSDADTQIVRNN